MSTLSSTTICGSATTLKLLKEPVRVGLTPGLTCMSNPCKLDLNSNPLPVDLASSRRAATLSDILI